MSVYASISSVSCGGQSSSRGDDRRKDLETRREAVVRGLVMGRRGDEGGELGFGFGSCREEYS